MPDRHMPPALRFMLAARRCELQGLETLALTCELVTLISQLVHALQRERGYSNIYLGHPQMRFLPILDSHTADALATERAVRECFERMDLDAVSAADRARLFNRIAHVIHGLDELPAIRRRVRDQQWSSVQATAAFTRLIGGLLGVVFEAADTALDPTITRALVAMFNFMQGKELAGQERAGGVAGFSGGYFTDEQRAHMQHLVDGQERCFEIFQQFGNPEATLHWQRQTASGNQAQLIQLRTLAQRTSKTDTVAPSLGELWFDLTSERIDTMKQIETELATDLLEQCRRSIQAANADLDNHRALLRRLADPDQKSDQPLLFSLQGNTLDSAPHDGIGSHLHRSILDLMQEQTQRLHVANDELKDARQTLDERKRVERAKALLIRDFGLSEAEAYKKLQQSAMERGLRLVEVADALLSQRSQSRRDRS